MIKQDEMEVVCQQQIAKDIYELTLEGSLVEEMAEPGQFVHVRSHDGLDPLLRRPISIAAFEQAKQQLTLIYRAEGKGTKILSQKLTGERVDVLGPLGNGFPIDALAAGQHALLIGGGIGVPPLYELSKQLTENGIQVSHVLGFETAEKAFYVERFSQFGTTYVATVDGTLGTKGFVTDVIDQNRLSFDCLYACGPTPMLKALEVRYSDRRAFLSLEERMGCGIGACFACVCHVANDPTGIAYRKICSDGPVFPIGEVVL